MDSSRKLMECAKFVEMRQNLEFKYWMNYWV